MTDSCQCVLDGKKYNISFSWYSDSSVGVDCEVEDAYIESVENEDGTTTEPTDEDEAVLEKYFDEDDGPLWKAINETIDGAGDDWDEPDCCPDVRGRSIGTPISEIRSLDNPWTTSRPIIKW